MRRFFVFAAVLAVMCFSVPAFATNGDNIIGVGAISRSMGGVGAAAPQDAISAVFANPAAMCYIPCNSSEVDFAATLFVPKVSAQVSTAAPSSVSADGMGLPYAFPAIGIYTPITPDLRFGLAAYGVSGLGVDYKDTILKHSGVGAFDIKTDLQVMKFSPNLAYRVLPNLSVGAALQVNWAQLDLGEGSAHTFSFGTQLGAIYKPIDPLSIGVTWQSPQSNKFRRVYNFDAAYGSTTFDTLKLEQPQQVVLGVGYQIIPNKLLFEVDEKWINWGNADGYKDFDWRDQYVTAVGIQGKPLDWLALRVGYNYGRNPVKTSNGWNPAGTSYIQGTAVPTAQLEGFKVVGFPAIIEHHLTAGIGVNLSKKVSVNLGYMHGFQNSIKETSAGGAITYESKLYEDSYELGLNIMF
ncbi:MAG: OmpP1/FadL family transporter [Nitrospirota bacterium]